MLNSNVYNSQTLNSAKFQLFVICMAVCLYYRPTPRSINSSPRSDSVMVVFSVIHNLDTLQFLRVISMTWLTAVSFSYIYYAHFYFSFLLILLYIYVLLIFPILFTFLFSHICFHFVQFAIISQHTPSFDFIPFFLSTYNNAFSSDSTIILQFPNLCLIIRKLT